MAKEDDDVALVFAQFGERRLRAGIAALLIGASWRRMPCGAFCTTVPAISRPRRVPPRRGALADIFVSVRDGLDGFLNDGPCHHPQFAMLAADIRIGAPGSS